MENKPTLTADQRIANQLNDSKDLQERQIRAAEGDEDAIKMVPGNRDQKSKIRETEKDYIHVAVVTRNLDAESKVFHDEARVTKHHPRIFPGLISSNAFAAYDEAKIIHDPRKNAPQNEVLKPAPPRLTNPLSDADLRANDAALAAREQKVTDREKRVSENLARMEQLSAQMNQAQQTPAPKQQQANKGVTGQAVPKQSPQSESSDLPPLPGS